MPSNDMEAYKRMYEMGQELMQMAEAGGYDPEGEEEAAAVEEEAPSAPAPMKKKKAYSKDKVGMAMSFL